MIPDDKPSRFCWVDLATVDAEEAGQFYRRMFGWQTKRQPANGGEFLLFTSEGKSIASLYQLDSRQVVGGVPSHWTPYVGVSNIDEVVTKTTAFGGDVIVEPFEVDGTARVSLIADPVGALVGLWELRK